MKTKVFFLLIFLSTVFSSYSQQPEKVLNDWGLKNPIEKVYLHFDRTGYFPGQTIWLKGYLYSDFLPSKISSSLYVELLHSSNKIIRRYVFPVFSGFSRGQIELPDTMQAGSYIIRAYTQHMLNHDRDFLYKKTVTIFGKSVAPVATATGNSRVEFFPEGGNFVAGLMNSLAFKITGEDGLPQSCSGKISKENGEVVTMFSTIHDGMGFVDIKPDESTKYFLTLDNDPAQTKHFLPQQSKRGIVLRVINTGKSRQFEILQNPDDAEHTAAYMIGQMQHHPLFRAEFKTVKSEITGIIKTDEYASGILQMTVFNKNGMPLAERITFIDNGEYLLNASLATDSLNLEPRALNRLTLSLKDTVVGSFSVSVFDETFEPGQARPENIVSSLLLTSDLKGYIHNPAYYFSSNDDSVKYALDLVMMTNGWRRFQWKEIASNVSTTNKFIDPGYINVAGKVFLEGTRKPFAEKTMVVFIVTADLARQVEMVTTDKEGNFRLDSLIYFKHARIFFSDIKGRKNKFIEVKSEGDSLTRNFQIPPFNLDDVVRNRYPSNDNARKLADEYDAIMKAEGSMLEEIIIKGTRKTRIEEYEEKHVSGLFAGESLRRMDFLTEDIGTYANVLDYLQMRVPGLTIEAPNYMDDEGTAGYRIYFRQSASISSMGIIPMTVFLDEVETDANVVAALPASQIAMVKLYSNFVGAAGGGAGGALAIYTKRGEDLLNSMSSSGDIIISPGYSVVKEFYSPDYSVSKENDKADNRITLLWNAGLIVADINPEVPVRFYNNDRTKRFRVVIEGMTDDGRLLMIEKTIGNQKAF